MWKKFSLVAAADQLQLARAFRWCVCRPSTCQKLYHQQHLKWTKIQCYFWIIDLPPRAILRKNTSEVRRFSKSHEIDEHSLEIHVQSILYRFLPIKKGFLTSESIVESVFEKIVESEDFFSFLASCRLGERLCKNPENFTGKFWCWLNVNGLSLTWIFKIIKEWQLSLWIRKWRMHND